VNLAEIKRNTIEILNQYPVSKAAIFGSFARGDFNSRSDIDILVELNETISLFTFIKIKQQLEDKLLRKVDLVEYKSLKPAISEQILKEQMPLIN